MTRPRRAPPLDRAARRAKIIEAVAPLLAARGGAVTTRELAQAAGVAEGTLFSVFDDKRSLMLAAIQGRLDPEPVRARLAELAALPDLEARLLGVWQVLTPQVEEFHALVVAMHGVLEGGGPMPPPGAIGRDHPFGRRGPPGYMHGWVRVVSAAVTELIAPYSAELRVTPARLAQVFVTLLLANRMPQSEGTSLADPRELIDFCLEGALKRVQER